MQLKVAVVGVGHLGRHHARILAGLPDVEFVGVADTNLDQARAVAASTNSTAFSDYRQLLDKVDAVSIAVPTRFHRAVAGEFLERSIPVMVEKPLAASLKEAEELVALADRRNALLQVGHIERFNPAFGTLENMAFRPKYIAAERLGVYTFRSTDIGVVLDLMIHDLDLILALVKAPVKSVTAVGVELFGGHEDVANARIEFEDGCVANITASRASFQPVRKMRLWGAEGYVNLDFATREGTVIRPSEKLRRGEVDLEGLDMTSMDRIKERIFGKILRVDTVKPEPKDALTLELSDFVNAVRSGARPRVTGADALRSMRLADQILRSLNAHAWEGRPDGPMGPHHLPEPMSEPHPGIPAPKSWRYLGLREDSKVHGE